MREIEYGEYFTFKNNKYTIPITFEFTADHDNKQANIYDRHKKIFEVMKLVENSTKMITTAGKVFEHFI